MLSSLVLRLLESGKNGFWGNLALFLPHQALFFAGNSPLGVSEGRFFERYPPLFKICQSPEGCFRF